MVSASQKIVGSKQVRILIVDDHPIVREGIRRLLEQEPDFTVCGEADDAEGALRSIRTCRPDLALLDISLKDSDGLGLLKTLQARYTGLPVLILSMYDERFYAERALRAGARGYIMKREAAENVVAAIRKVLQGEMYASDAIRQHILEQVSHRRGEDQSSPVDCLSDRELEIFQLIGRGNTTRQIAEKLRLSVSTVDTHRAHIRQKMGLESTAQLVRCAVQWVETQSKS